MAPCNPFRPTCTLLQWDRKTTKRIISLSFCPYSSLSLFLHFYIQHGISQNRRSLISPLLTPFLATRPSLSFRRKFFSCFFGWFIETSLFVPLDLEESFGFEPQILQFAVVFGPTSHLYGPFLSLNAYVAFGFIYKRWTKPHFLHPFQWPLSFPDTALHWVLWQICFDLLVRSSDRDETLPLISPPPLLSWPKVTSGFRLELGSLLLVFIFVPYKR